ncbi:F-box protein [Sesamum alatum]|uniref:F-box protein n=1 Tax=Sesamum alatum TaxID=300844 RepID=A0AAE2CJ68_9LAMI|nr:F-box protein [Sesamum alatum]
MSEGMMQSFKDSSDKSRQPVQPYQPVWMAHWMPLSRNAAADRDNPSVSENEEIKCVSKDADLTNGLEASRSLKEHGVIETKTFDILNESPRMSSKILGNEGMSSSLVKHGQDTDDMQILRPISSHNLERGKATDCKVGIQFPPVISAASDTSLRGTSKNSLEWIKPHSSASSSEPFKGTFVGSSPNILPYYDLEKHRSDKGKATIFPLISNQLPNTNLRMFEQEHCHKHSESAGLICERKIYNHSESDTLVKASFTECNTSLLFDAPSTSGHHLPRFDRDWFQKCPGISLLPSQSIASEKTESKKSHYDSYSLQKLPNYVRDLETMRICTTMDSVQAIPGCCPMLSQTTHGLLITKRSDVNLSQENDIFGTARLITKMNGNTSSNLHNLSPFFGQGNRGVKLQPLSSSSSSEGKRNVGDLESPKVTRKNESSAETDTMDMDLFKEENPNSGAHSTPSIEGFNIKSTLSTRIDIASSKEVGRLWTDTSVPDMNLEPPALLAAASSSENMGPSSSRTQSLEVDMLLANSDQANPKPHLAQNDSSKADASNRWVKRLKLSSSGSSAQGTKSSNSAENSSHDKMRKGFRRFHASSITSSEPTPGKHQDKETIQSDRSADLSKEDRNTTIDTVNKGKELLGSHAWIKRWLRCESSTPPKKPETVVICEPQTSKLALDDLQKKQFPSIAAMALMGKAMSGFQSCELQKRGCFTVWNTKTF